MQGAKADLPKLRPFGYHSYKTAAIVMMGTNDEALNNAKNDKKSFFN